MGLSVPELFQKSVVRSECEIYVFLISNLVISIRIISFCNDPLIVILPLINTSAVEVPKEYDFLN